MGRVLIIFIITLLWDAPETGPEPDGYVVHYGRYPNELTSSIDVGDTLRWTMYVDQTTYFAVTAYNDDGSSELSNIIRWPELKINKISFTQNGVILEWEGTALEMYSVLSSEDLEVWTVQGEVYCIVNGTMTWEDTEQTNKRFYKVEVKENE